MGAFSKMVSLASAFIIAVILMVPLAGSVSAVQGTVPL